MNEDHLIQLAKELSIPVMQIAATAKLLEDGATVPFIARYRKEATGTLDEVAITAIRDGLERLKALDDRRESIKKSLSERNLLTDELSAAIAAAETLAKLEDIYRQQFVGLVDTRPLGEGLSLRSDLRYFDSRNDGAERAGNIDNRNFNAMFTLGVRAHKFTATWQQMSGDSAFPFVNGGDPFTVNLVTYNTFTRAGLDSWQVRYDYDFVAMGIPGLSFMTRYTDGRHAETATVSNGRERERDTDLTYVIQSGPFKDVSLRWRNVTFRSGNGLTNAVDENRLIIGYTLALW